MVVRLPLIRQFQLDQGNVNETTEFASHLGNVREVNLMPFYQIGESKYYRLCREY